MTRDYAKKRPRPPAGGPKTQVPAWVWLFTGSVLGAFVMFLVYLAGIPPQPGTIAETLNDAREAVDDKPERKHRNRAAGDADGTQTPKPRFDFYQLLRESEVVVNPEPIPREAVTASRENVEYILQVGSFKSPGDADRLRAQLLLLNLNAKVETVKVRNAETWHRVLVGPFTSRATMDKARGTLANNQLDSLLLKRGAEG